MIYYASNNGLQKIHKILSMCISEILINDRYINLDPLGLDVSHPIQPNSDGQRILALNLLKLDPRHNILKS